MNHAMSRRQRKKSTGWLVVSLFTVLSFVTPAAAQTAVTGARTGTVAGAANAVVADDYAAAARLLSRNLQGLVRNESVQPHWIGDSGRFWYRRDGAAGPEFVVVTAAGVKSPAFDHAALARALTEALGEQGAGKGLPAALAGAQLSDDLKRLSGRIGKRSVDCELLPPRCRVFDTPAPTPELLPSPDGRWAAFARGDNLFVRETATGAERQLTSDGAPFYSWAKLPDGSMVTAPFKKRGTKTPPFETYWSPDGRYLIAPRIDERKLAMSPVVEWAPADGSHRPIVHELRLPFPGDRESISVEFFLFDVATGQRRAIALPEDYRAGMQGFVWWDQGLAQGWSRSRGQAFLLARTVGSKSVAVFRLALESGALTKVVEESAATRVELNSFLSNQPNLRVIGDGDELIWYSDRGGWGHLYLHDAQSGRLKHAITRGEWLVHDIAAVDEARREVYFVAGGREPGRDPYYRHLYRVRLDESASVQLLTEPDADHHFDPNPSGMTARLFGQPPRGPMIQAAAGVFIDTWSTVGEPPVSVLRSTRDGRVIAELERADATALLAAGWQPPVRERVKAADGATELFAVYYAPYGRRAGQTYPVIDAAYGGPQLVVTPKNFSQAWRGGAALARLGFAVITVDGRGTPGRSRAFRDAGYPEFTQVGIDDHIAAIRELARRRPELDLERVGVNGWSWGGTFAAQAILSRPEFYKVAVSGAGAYDYAALPPGFEAFTGLAQYADGSHYRGKPGESPGNWQKLDITRMAPRLKGHLLIIYAEQDENVPPHQAFRLIDALTRAGKPYDLVYLPNRTHGGAGDGYTIKRTWDYFIERLAGARPVFDAVVTLNSSPPF